MCACKVCVQATHSTLASSRLVRAAPSLLGALGVVVRTILCQECNNGCWWQHSIAPTPGASAQCCRCWSHACMVRSAAYVPAAVHRCNRCAHLARRHNRPSLHKQPTIAMALNVNQCAIQPRPSSSQRVAVGQALQRAAGACDGRKDRGTAEPRNTTNPWSTQPANGARDINLLQTRISNAQQRTKHAHTAHIHTKCMLQCAANTRTHRKQTQLAEGQAVREGMQHTMHTQCTRTLVLACATNSIHGHQTKAPAGSATLQTDCNAEVVPCSTDVAESNAQLLASSTGTGACNT
jgi:hypothetical protein